MKPLKKNTIFILFITIISTLLLGTKVSAETIVKTPELSVPAGLYTEEFDLAITSNNDDTTIYYTIDGSEPDINQSTTYSYTAPIRIKFQGVREAASSYFCGTVIRAVAIDQDDNRSEVVTASYFVDKNIVTRYGLPIVSITTNKDNLFDSSIGIMSQGNTGNKGMEWERPIHFEYFDLDGKLQLSMNAGIRLHGGASRDWVFKSFRIYARAEYDEEDQFDYNFFANSVIPSIEHNGDNQGKALTKFKRLLLRNGGNEGTAGEGTFIRDVLAQALMVNTTLDLQSYSPAVTFLNGEFYGIQNVQEREDEKYLEDHYNIDEDSVAIYEFSYDDLGAQEAIVANGDETDAQYYQTIIEFIKNNDLSLSENYEQIKKWFDIENYVDYQIINLYGANGDWPGNNCKAWRAKTEYNPEAEYGLDGKIRWLAYDLDFSFGLYDLRKVTLNSLNDATKVGGTHWPNQDGSTILLRKLLENNEFRTYFCQRYLDLLNTNFDKDYVNSLIDTMSEPYKTSIDEFRSRFHTMRDYEENINNLKTFVEKRGDICKSHIATKYNLGMLYFLSLNTCNANGDALGGKVLVNTVTIDSTSNGIKGNLWKKSYYNGLATMLTAVADEGYEFVSWSGATDSSETTINASELAKDSSEVILTPVFRLLTDSAATDEDETAVELTNSTDSASMNEAIEVLGQSKTEIQKETNTKDTTMYLISIIILVIIIIIMAIYMIVRNRQGKLKS